MDLLFIIKEMEDIVKIFTCIGLIIPAILAIKLFKIKKTNETTSLTRYNTLLENIDRNGESSIKEYKTLLENIDRNGESSIKEYKILLENIDRNLESSIKEYKILLENIDRKVSSYAKHMISKPKDNDISARNSFNIFDNNESLFDARKLHFHEEKIELCKMFLKSICTNTEITQNDKIYLCLDSGSTIFPIFDLLCNYFWDKGYAEVLKKIIIVTNNLPGVSVLTSKGRKGLSADAEMMFECHVIPGLAEGKYNAILGDEGSDYLMNFFKKRKDNESKVTAIAVVTGNYLSTEDGILWRGDHHGKVKNAMLNVADHIYIISPLGKIFKKSCQTINEINKVNPLSSKVYKDLRHEDASIEQDVSKNKEMNKIEMLIPSVFCSDKRVSLVTTSRSSDKKYPSFLRDYFTEIIVTLQTIFGDNLIKRDFSPSIESGNVIAELLLFSKQEEEAYLNYEFPHKEVRAYIREKSSTKLEVI